MVYVGDVVRVKKNANETQIDVLKPHTVEEVFYNGYVGIDRNFIVHPNDIEPWSVRDTIAARMNMITQLQREVDDLQRQLDEDGDES